jgi:hypothetical protein
LIDEKLSLRGIVFLGEASQERSCWIGAVPSKQHHVENQLCVDVYCSIQPRPLTVDFDSGLANGDPLRLRRRRVRTAVSEPMNPISNLPVRAFNTEFSENRSYFSKRTAGRVKADGERPDGRRRPLTLPSFF